MKLSQNKSNRLREIGIDGGGVFFDYNHETTELNRPKQINDYRNMLRDGTVEALFNIVTMPILASEYSIEPEDDGKEAETQAEFVRSNLFSENYKGGIETPFDLFLDQAMMALVDGFQCWEKVYRLKNGRYELKKLALRDSRSITIISDKRDGYQGIRQIQEDGSEVEIPAYKTFLFTHGKRYDTLYGRSIFTALWKNYDKKQKLEYLDSIALQNDAIKPKILKPTTDNIVREPKANLLSKALNILGRLGKINSVASIPRGYEVEVLDSNGRDPHQSIERQNSEMARVFLANFMLLGTQGASSTGSFALSATQAKIFKMSLESILDKLASHINQYIIADLIDINFTTPHYPTFKFEKLDDDVISAVFNAFTVLAQKDRISDAMASEIEDVTASRLGFDVEKIREKREASKNKTIENGTEEISDKVIDTSPRKNLSEQHNDEPSEHMKQLNDKWQELERRFLDQIRPIYEVVAEELTDKVAEAKFITDIDEVKFPIEYRKVLVSTFKQGFQVGKISVSDELGIAAPKSSGGLGKAAAEYIDWIIEKQQNDLTAYAKQYAADNNMLFAESDDNNKLKIIEKLLLGWFAEKLLATASYMIAQAVNSGRNSMWNDNDLLRYSAILDSRTTAGCTALNGKVMTWKEWQQYPEYLPPRHFNCRSTFVKISGGTPEEETDNPNHDLIHKIDYITNTKKADLIKENLELARYTKEELLSIEAYKGNGFININQTLLGNKPMNEYAENDIKHLDKAIKKAVLEKDITLYRGIGLMRQLQPGDYIDHPNYASTSFNFESALSFAKDADYKKYLLEFRAPKGMPYLDVEKVMKDNKITTLLEDEYLLSRGKKFVVKSVEVYNNGIQKVVAEMTDDTKYLSDSGVTKVSPEEQKRLDEALARIETEEKSGKRSSRVRQRLHEIWKMESDYFNSHPEAIRSANDDSEDK